jgi:hypothetical protein
MTAAQNEAAALFANQDRVTRHHSDRASSSSEADSDFDLPIESVNPPLSDLGPNYHLPRTHFNANTGPKGVIADAHSFEKTKRDLRRRRSPKAAFRAVFREKSATPESENDAEPGDDEFMRLWRKNRIVELRDSPSPAPSRRQSPSKRRYGKVDTVDAVGYLDAIEKVGKETVVAVCIYDDEVSPSCSLHLLTSSLTRLMLQSEISGMVEDCLPALARRHITTRFVKLHYLEAEMDPASVPAMLGYKEGELVANLVSLVDEIPSDQSLNTQSLETLFKQ